MLKFTGFLGCWGVFFCTDALENRSPRDIVFVNHTEFSYSVDASNLRQVEFFQWNQEAKQTEKIEYTEIEPGVEKECTLWFENRAAVKSADGSPIDYGKIAVRKSGNGDRHMADITFNAPYYGACVSPSLNGNYSLMELVDEQKEFAITKIYMPRRRKFGKHFVFFVEKFEEGKETYVDWDQYFGTTDEPDEDVGSCCGIWRKKKQKNNQRNFLPEERITVASSLLRYGLSPKFVSEYTGLSVEKISSL
jgi:hypothetical protein